MVYLKPINGSEALKVYKMVERSRASLPFMWADGATYQSVHEYLTSKHNSRTDTVFGMYIGDGNLVGLFELRDKQFHYQVGYWLDVNHRGRGYATESLKAAISKSNKAVTAQVAHDNKISLSVMQGAGMYLIGGDSEWLYFSSLIPNRK